MKIKGFIETDIIKDREDWKELMVTLGSVRCPKCHKEGYLRISIVFERGNQFITPAIWHVKEGYGKACYLRTIVSGEFGVEILNEIVTSDRFE